MNRDERPAKSRARRATKTTATAFALIATLQPPAFAQRSRATVAAAREAPLVVSRISLEVIANCRFAEARDNRSTHARVSATDGRWLRRFRASLEREISRRTFRDLDQSVRAAGDALDVSGSFRAAFGWDGARWQISAQLAPDAPIAAVQSTLLGTVLGALAERAAPATGSEIQVSLQLTAPPRVMCGLRVENLVQD